MDSLPPELQDYILRELDLDDLARCARVSRELRKAVHRVLQTITSVHRKKDDTHYEYPEVPEQKQVALALRYSAPKHTVSMADFTAAGSGSFLRFVTKYCPHVSSLVATSVSVLLEDIAALGPRLTSFLLHDIKSSSNLIDARSLAENFPNLQFYKLRNGSECGNRVMREFSLIMSRQYAQYDEVRFIHFSDRVDVRSIESLKLISVLSSLDVHKLRPSTLNSLKFLRLGRLVSDSENLPPLPNLLSAILDCDHNLNNMIPLLYNSPKLSAAYFAGKVDNGSLSALRILFSVCPALQVFTLYHWSSNGHNIGDDNKHSLDLSQVRSLRQFYWSRINAQMEVILPSKCQRVMWCSREEDRDEREKGVYWVEGDVDGWREEAVIREGTAGRS